MAYTSEEIETIFESVIQSMELGNSLRAALKEHDGLSSSTFYIWMNDDESKSKRYALAARSRADALFDKALEISETPELGETTETNSEGKIVKTVKGDMINHRRLKVDTIKWYLSKLEPSKYGDKTETTIIGDIEAPPIQIVINKPKTE